MSTTFLKVVPKKHYLGFVRLLDFQTQRLEQPLKGCAKRQYLGFVRLLDFSNSKT